MYNQALAALLKSRKHRSNTIFADPFVSFEVMGLIKIGNLYGLKSNLKSPLIFNELIEYEAPATWPELPFMDFSDVIDLSDEERIAKGYAFPWEKKENNTVLSKIVGFFKGG